MSIGRAFVPLVGRRPNLGPFVQQEAEPSSLCSAGGRTFPFVVRGRRPRFDSRRSLVVARPKQAVSVEPLLLRLRYFAEQRPLPCWVRSHGRPGRNRRFQPNHCSFVRGISPRSTVLSFVRGTLPRFERLRPEQAVPRLSFFPSSEAHCRSSSVLGRNRRFRAYLSFLRPRHVAEV